MKFSHCRATPKTYQNQMQGVVFRQFKSVESTRMFDIIEGKVTELLPEDFGDVTILEDKVLCNASNNMGIVFALLPKETMNTNLEKITLGTSISQIGKNTSSENLSFFPGVNHSVRIIFPKSLTKICGIIGDQPFETADDAIWVTYDFTNLEAVPTWEAGSTEVTDSSFIKGSIVVPNKLLDSWKTASYWSNVADRIVGG